MDERFPTVGLRRMNRRTQSLFLLAIALWAGSALAYGGGGASPSPGMPGAGMPGSGMPGANGSSGSTAPQKAKSLTEYFTDLVGDEAGERAFAARYLLGEVRRHSWTYEHSQPGSIANLDARSALTELDARLPDACESALLFVNSAVFCAEMLAILERGEFVEQVTVAAAGARNKSEAKRFAAALETLRMGGQAPPPAGANVSVPPLNGMESAPPPSPTASP